MAGFIEGVDREQLSLLPERLEDWVDDSNPVRVIDAFVEALDLKQLGFDTAVPAGFGRPGYHPAIHLKLYIYGYLYRVQSSRRLERECQRNLEVMWLIGRLAPDFKTIADFRKDNGPAIKKVCAQFVELCRQMGLLAKASVAIDGSKFKAVNNRDKNYTVGKIGRRRTQLEASVARYLSQLDTADLQDPSETVELKRTRLKEKLEKLNSEMAKLAAIEKQVLASPDKQISLTDPDSRLDGDERTRLGRRRLQRADRGRYREPPDRRARSDERRQRHGASRQHRRAGQGGARGRHTRGSRRSRLFRRRADPRLR
jgi:transposase